MKVDLGRVTAEMRDIQSHSIGFALWINPQDVETEEPDIQGIVKWDGCVNWTTNGRCMAHFCSVHDMDALNHAFKWVHAEAGEKIPNADKGSF